MPLGLYLSAPFCRSKCSYCNFSSAVYPQTVYAGYCDLLAREIELAAAADGERGAAVDSIYWGGGTPTLLPIPGLSRVFETLRATFRIESGAEHTFEAAPGTLPRSRLEQLANAGVNRISLGAQSFHEPELRAVGRLHRPADVGADVARLRAAGITNFNLDLMVGLPHQTFASWQASLQAALALEPPHLSVYMLEVDEDSRLGHELLAGGARYHAHHVPDDDLIADGYEWACGELDRAGLRQYEISNFARPGLASRHNERYWLRQPYLGFGVDAHSFLTTPHPRRFANPEGLEDYCAPLRARHLPRGPELRLSPESEREEYYFLGLRRAAGVELRAGGPQVAVVPELVAAGLLSRCGDRIALTPRGRMLSNRVFTAMLEPEMAT